MSNIPLNHRRVFGLLWAALGVVVLLLVAPMALRAAPDLTVTVGLDGSTLHGATTSGSFTITNASGENGFNLSLTLTTPEGVTLGGSDLPPSGSFQDPVTFETTYFFENVSDAPDGTTSSFGFTLDHDPAVWIVGESFTVDGAGFVSSDPRLVPDFDAATGTVTGDFDGTGSGSGGTTIVPFTVSKSIAAPEGELLRGVHDHQTTAIITITNADAGATSAVSVVDHLDAGLEFLACGVPDNSAFRTEEYPGSGPIPAAGPPADCLDPDTVETVVDPAGFPAGTYTRVAWTLADLAPGETRSLTYRVAIPLNENTADWDTTAGPGTGVAPAPASLAQAANLDNNNGDLTTETDPETSLGNVAAVTGTYQGDTLTPGDPLTVEGSAGVAAEDLRMRKAASTGTSVIGTATTWTITIETSEYVTGATDLVLTDLVPSGLCPGADPDVAADCDTAGPSPAYDPGFPVANGDGTYTLQWTLADLGTNDTTTITYTTRQRGEFGSGDPIEIGQGWSNQTTVTGTTETIDGTTTNVGDEGTDSQTTPTLTFDKQVAVPPAGQVCGDGSGLDWSAAAPVVGAGDRVCWRLIVESPAVRSRDVTVVDLLPLGFGYESAAPGAGNTVPVLITDFDDSGAPNLVWRLGAPPDRILPPALRFEWVVSTIADDPDTYGIGDLVGNLMKITSANGDGDVFFDRDDIEITWGRPELSLEKAVEGVDADTPGAAYETVGGGPITYEVAITNDGNVTAVDVDARDLLPDWPTGGCAVVSAISDGGTCADEAGADVIQWDGLGPIAPGATITVSYDVAVPTGIAPEEVFRNDAGVERYFADTSAGTQFEYVPEDNLDPAAGTPNAPAADDPAHVRAPSPPIDKTLATTINTATNGADEATVGEGVTFTATVTVPAGTTVYDASILDNLTDAFEFSAVQSFTVDGAAPPPGFAFDPDDNGNGILGDLRVTFPPVYTVPAGGPDSVIELEFLATVADVPSVLRGGTAINAVNFLWEDSQQNNRQVFDVAALTVVEPSIRLQKTNDDADGQLDPGQTVDYTLRLRNRTVIAATTAWDSEVVDTLPTGVTCGDVSGITGGGTCAGNEITWTVPSIEPGAANDVIVEYSVTYPDPLVIGTAYRNEAEARTTSLPGPSPQERTGASDCGLAPGTQVCSDYVNGSTSTISVPGGAIFKQVRLPGGLPGPSVEQTIGEPVLFEIELTIPPDLVAFDPIIIDRLPPGIRTAASTGYTTVASCLTCNGGTNPDITITELPATANRVGWALNEALGGPGAGLRVLRIEFEAIVLDVPENVEGTVRTNRVEAAANTSDLLPPFTVVPPPGGFEINSNVATADVIVREPNLLVDKQVFEFGAPVPGDSRRAIEATALQYRINVTNDSAWPAYDVDVSDTIDIPSANAMGCAFPEPTCVYLPPIVPLPPGVTPVDVDPSDDTLAFTIDVIPPGETVTIIYGLEVWSPASTADEDPLGPEILNVGSVDRFLAVPPGDLDADNREYVGPDDDTEVELDLATVGDLVWFDVNGDGVRQVLLEPVIEGVVVTADYLDGVLVTTDDDDTTDDSNLGNWLIDDLPGGAFRIFVDPATLPGWATPSYDLDGIGTPNEWTGVIAEDGDPRDVDFGYTGTGTLGDTIFWDLDGDGTQDADEPGFPGVRVDLVWAGFDGDITTPTDNVDYQATTDADGVWLAEDLPGGPFSIVVNTSDLPAGVDNTADPDGGFDSSALVTLPDGGTDLDQDFGYRGRGSLGDLVWLDLDRSGTATPDPGEPGIADVDVGVTWFGDDGVPGGGDDVSFTRTTDDDGLWLAPGLVGGGYDVTVDPSTLPDGLDVTFDRDGTLDGSTTATLADADDVDLDVDVAYGGSGRIGDTVWWDVDGDGTRDPGEPGIPGADVLLRWAGPDGVFEDAIGSDDVTWLNTTDAAGAYGQDRLPGGTFRATITDPFGTGLPSLGEPTFDLDGVGTPHEATFSLALGETNLDVDFGYRGDNALGDLVWFDVDDSGTVTGSEPGLDGIDVDLVWAGLDGTIGTADDLALTTATAGGGVYGFAGLFDGPHRVTADDTDVPTGLAASYDFDGGDDSSTDVDLSGGAALDTVDFGYRGDAEIGDLVFLDTDADFQRDPFDPGIPGVDLFVTWPGPDGLLDTGDDVVFVETTDADGLYLRDGLPGGVTHRVMVDETTTPPGTQQTFDPDGPPLPIFPRDAMTEVALGPGESFLDADFGYAGQATIGDRVWWDTDGDGVQDAGEPGIPGVSIRVTWAGVDTVLGTADDVSLLPATTGTDGSWQVTAVAGGGYLVEAVAPPGLDPSFDSDGVGTPNESIATITPGVDDLDQDFGYVGAGSLGDLVWVDVDGDGAVGPAEPPIPGAGLTLTWAGVDGALGTGDDVALPEATTDATGLYGFAGLGEGAFRVTVTSGVPAGLAPSFDVDGIPDGSADVALGPAEARDDVDFGFVGAGTLGDSIWWDVDGDGIQAAGEPGFPGVGVTVVWAGIDATADTGDDVTYAVTTDPAGQWLVDLLPAGQFSVTVDAAGLPAGLVATADPDGGDDDTAVATLGPAATDLDQDFGYTGSLAVGDLVWRDTDRDGAYGLTEEALAGVGITVTFLGADGAPGGGDDVVFTYVTGAGGTGSVPLSAFPTSGPGISAGGVDWGALAQVVAGGAPLPGDPQYLAGGLVPGAYDVTVDVTTLPAGSEPLSSLDGGDPTTTRVDLDGTGDELAADFGVFINDAPEVDALVGSTACGTDLFVDPLDGVVDPNGDEVTLVEDSISAPDGVTVTVEPDGRLRITTDGTITDDYEVSWDVVDARGAVGTAVLTVEVDCLEVEVAATCVDGEIPYLTWSAVGTGAEAEAPLTISWFDADGGPQVSETGAPLEGTEPWPGFEVDADGNLVSFPDGPASPDAWVLGGAQVTFVAANGPVVGPFAVEYPCEQLPVTGSDPLAPAAVGLALLVLGTGIVLATRRERTLGSPARP